MLEVGAELMVVAVVRDIMEVEAVVSHPTSGAEAGLRWEAADTRLGLFKLEATDLMLVAISSALAIKSKEGLALTPTEEGVVDMVGAERLRTHLPLMGQATLVRAGGGH